MGDRLVSRIAYKGQFFAASYQHWAASDWKRLEDILDKTIVEHGFFDDDHIRTKEEAVQILFEMLTKYNNSIICNPEYKPKPGLSSADTIFTSWEGDEELIDTPYHSDEQEAFNKNSSLPLCQNRSDGIITVDETIANDWEDWAEAINDFDFS